MESLKTLLIANRGEIAVRLITTAKALGVRTVAIYSESDASSKHVQIASEAVLLAGLPNSVYTDGDQIISIAKKAKADAIIPGYGFLSENADFADQCEENGICFVGPSAQTINAFGIKHIARQLAEKAGVPIVPGTKDLVDSAEVAVQHADRLGYPVMLKATGGGGGMGLMTCYNSGEVTTGFEQTRSRGEALFKNAGVFIERYYPASHHIEVQIFGNGQGDVISFGERECSIQRRRQKVIEECPSPFVIDLRPRLTEAAILLAKSVNYESAGTIEYLVDDQSQDFFFLEMNTRLQVEHGITEKCYDVDLVGLMLKQADSRLAGKKGISGPTLLAMQRNEPKGAAIEARIYAENPARNFTPSPGLLQEVSWHESTDSRIDTWIYTGCKVSPYYDPLLAKAIVHKPDRAQAQAAMGTFLQKTRICGPPTNLEFLLAIVQASEFQRGHTLTTFLDDFPYTPSAIEVLSGGAYTLVQDLGRPKVGHGVPRAGAMDPVAYQVANLLVGNKTSVEALEITLNGPELVFHHDAIVSLTGASIEAQLDDKAMPMWTRVKINRAQRLKIGALTGNGCRAYLGVFGGFLNVATYFGSKATSPLVGIGGYQGRQLAPGDLLNITTAFPSELRISVSLPPRLIPSYCNDWTVDAMEGPYSEGFITTKGKDTMFSTSFKVSHNASRGGIRLIGPTPEWARANGGDGGSHPSNIQEYGYSTGALNWTGDEAVILPMDSPNFGGFVSTLVTAKADWWKLGQLRPGASVRFFPISYEDAARKREKLKVYLSNVARFIGGEEVHQGIDLDLHVDVSALDTESIVIWSRLEDTHRPAAMYRQAGDDYVLLEFGDGRFDLNNLYRVGVLEQQILNDQSALLADGLVSLVIGCCSLMVHFDCDKLQLADVVAYLQRLEGAIGDLKSARVPCRKFKLPISYNNHAQKEATKRYMETQRPHAPYLPDNFKFVADSNAMTADDLKTMLLTQELMAFNIGFFCGATVFLPVDPRYRIACPKTNPSRVFTPEGSVSWGGSCMAIYPVDSPGGFQMLGRTVPYFDLFGTKKGFSTDRPWLYQSFDVISFYEVEDSEMERLIQLFRSGRYEFAWDTFEFDMAKHNELLGDTAGEVKELKKIRDRCQDRMIEAEMQSLSKWRAEKKATVADATTLESLLADPQVTAIESPLDSNVWKINVTANDVLEPEQVVCVLEAMKMEVAVRIPANVGKVHVTKICTSPGTTVKAGANLVLVKRI